MDRGKTLPSLSQVKCQPDRRGKSMPSNAFELQQFPEHFPRGVSSPPKTPDQQHLSSTRQPAWSALKRALPEVAHPDEAACELAPKRARLHPDPRSSRAPPYLSTPASLEDLRHPPYLTARYQPSAANFAPLRHPRESCPPPRFIPPPAARTLEPLRTDLRSDQTSRHSYSTSASSITQDAFPVRPPSGSSSIPSPNYMLPPTVMHRAPSADDLLRNGGINQLPAKHQHWQASPVGPASRSLPDHGSDYWTQRPRHLDHREYRTADSYDSYLPQSRLADYIPRLQHQYRPSADPHVAYPLRNSSIQLRHEGHSK